MKNKLKDDYIFLDTYTIQQDMRLRLPKILEKNMEILKGETKFDIYLKNDKTEILLKIHKE